MSKQNVVKSDKSHARLDKDSRLSKASNMIKILQKHCDLESAEVLDVGTGAGTIASKLGEVAKKVKSVDIFDERIDKKGYIFQRVRDESLPFPDNTFDVVVSNHVIEHTPNRKLHLSEINRVLKKDGVLYMATPNKWWIKDPHYRLYFIFWMPRNMANKYLKCFRGADKEWDIYPTSSNFIKANFQCSQSESLFEDMIKSIDKPSTITTIIRSLPAPLIRLLERISPTLVFLLKK